MRYEIGAGVIVYARPEWDCHRAVIAWAHTYPNGWLRRTTMDRDGRAIYTIWAKPKEGEK